jgi:hypothetical protein
MDSMRDAAVLAVDRSGGGAELARKISDARGAPLTRQAVYQWRRVPSALVLLVEKISGVSKEALRPDLYPEPSPPTAPDTSSEPAEAQS